MNPFEYFQQMKPQIERDEAIMRNLRAYAFGYRWSLTYLSRGTSNIHFRIGKIGDLWLATREFEPDTWRADGQTQKIFAESYIEQLLEAYESGKRVPIVCGGVKVEDSEERHFMLLEDLTAGGNKTFIARKGVYGIIDGLPIFHDFPEEGRKKSFKYMADEKMLILKK